MFDSGTTSWTGGLRRSPAQANLPLLTLEDLCELYSPQSSRRSSVNMDMDATSPTSPLSAVSPTSSEQSLTPSTPVVTSFDLVWETSKPSINLSLVPKSKASSFSSDKNRRLTHHHTQRSPKSCSPTEQWFRRRTETVCRTKFRMSTPEVNTKLSVNQLAQNIQVNQSGDAAMSSPPDQFQQETGEEGRKNVNAHERRISSSEQGDSDIDSGLATSTTSSTEAASVVSSNLAIRTRPAVQHIDQQDGSMSQFDFQQQRRVSHCSLGGRSQDCATRRHHRRTTSSSQSCSRIGKKNSNKTTRMEIIVPDTRKTELRDGILHLGIPLVPLISVTNGLAHPDFPRSILQYHLLTHDQLDSLAHWYHQTVDNSRERYMYPAVIERPWVWHDRRTQPQTDRRGSVAGTAADQTEDKQLKLSTKRRRFGRFIGLRGCESPIMPKPNSEDDEEQETDVAERMEREWKAALKRAEEEEKLQEKVWRGRW